MLLSRGRATKDFRVKLLDQGLYIQVCITDTAKKNVQKSRLHFPQILGRRRRLVHRGGGDPAERVGRAAGWVRLNHSTRGTQGKGRKGQSFIPILSIFFPSSPFLN